MKRWFLRAAAALLITAALAYIVTPPGYLRDQFDYNPSWVLRSLAVVLAVTFLIVWIADLIVIWATRGPRDIRGRGVVSFVTGLISGLLAATLWFAFVSVLFAPVGIVAAWLVIREERRGNEGHSLLNLSGLALNVVALGVFASQIVTATIWR